MEILQKRLIDLRESKRLTHCDVAQVLCITPGAYGCCERGKANPPLDNLIKLAKLFGVTTDYLLGVEAKS